MVHPLENKLNAPANDILEAISSGFRTQVDVKGKLAELYLYRQLKKLETRGIISNIIWHDVDGQPDFEITFQGRSVQIECKNLRNENYKGTNPSYKVEIQKTRNSKDGTNTRSYTVDYFDILAVCTFNQTGNWEFVFIDSSNLERVESNNQLLKIMQRVPIRTTNPWKKNIVEVLQS